jgi:hypothetical protein
MLSLLPQPADLLSKIDRLNGFDPTLLAGFAPDRLINGWSVGLAAVVVAMLLRRLWRFPVLLSTLIMIGFEAGLSLIVSHSYSTAVLALFAKLQ